MNKVELAFEAIRSRIVVKADCYEVMKKILHRMKGSDKIWWFASEFVDIHYKSPQRLSDLSIHYSELVESRPLQKGNGKVKVYRLKSKKFPKWAK
jgi:hypothetical protein